MKQCLSLLLAAALVALPLPTQAKEGKDQDRLENCASSLPWVSAVVMAAAQ